jgi:SAM-dependent methyltransferase
MTSSRDDLEDTYRGYERAGSAVGRWSSTNRGNQAMHEARNAAFESILDRCALGRPLERLLEVGCGEGTLLGELSEMRAVRSAACIGVDLLGFRLLEGRAGGRVLPVAQADGQRLPFPDGVIDVVVLSTVLSSVDDDTIASAIASEVDRVLRPDGSVLWYDMRYPNPSNRHVHPMRRARVEELFRGYACELRSLTLLPQLARRLGRSTNAVYSLLAALPPLRSHLVGRLTKPG